MRKLSGFPIQQPLESVADGVKIVDPLKEEFVAHNALGADVRVKAAVGKMTVAVKLLNQNAGVAEVYEVFVVQIAYL